MDILLELRQLEVHVCWRLISGVFLQMSEELDGWRKRGRRYTAATTDLFSSETYLTLSLDLIVFIWLWFVTELFIYVSIRREKLRQLERSELAADVSQVTSESFVLRRFSQWGLLGWCFHNFASSCWFLFVTTSTLSLICFRKCNHRNTLRNICLIRFDEVEVQDEILQQVDRAYRVVM